MSDCLFCKIAQKKISSDLVFEDDEVVAFKDIHPQAPVHVLLIPRKHISKISDLQDGDEKMMGALISNARKLAAEKSWQDYRLVFNNGASAGQSVFHIHLHLLSGRAFAWPPG